MTAMAISWLPYAEDNWDLNYLGLWVTKEGLFRASSIDNGYGIVSWLGTRSLKLKKVVYFLSTIYLPFLKNIFDNFGR